MSGLWKSKLDRKVLKQVLRGLCLAELCIEFLFNVNQKMKELEKKSDEIEERGRKRGRETFA